MDEHLVDLLIRILILIGIDSYHQQSGSILGGGTPHSQIHKLHLNSNARISHQVTGNILDHILVLDLDRKNHHSHRRILFPNIVLLVMLNLRFWLFHYTLAVSFDLYHTNASTNTHNDHYLQPFSICIPHPVVADDSTRTQYRPP